MPVDKPCNAPLYSALYTPPSRSLDYTSYERARFVQMKTHLVFSFKSGSGVVQKVLLNKQALAACALRSTLSRANVDPAKS